MNIRLALVALLLLALPVRAEPPEHPALAEWAAAWQANDAARLSALYDAEARVLVPDARVQAVGDRAVALSLGQDCAEIVDRRLEFTRHRWLQRGDTAVSSGTAWATFLATDGEQTQLSLRFSMVWAATEAGWRIIDQHLSLLPFDDE